MSTTHLNDFSRGDRVLAAWEIVSVVVSCLLIEWVVIALYPNNKVLMAIPLLLSVGQIILSHQHYGEKLSDLGFRTDNFGSAAKFLLVPTVLVVVAVVLVGGFLRDGQPMATVLRPRLLLLPFWALFQQYALQAYLNRRAQVVFGLGWKSVLTVAVLFSVLHFPNPVLSLLTFVGGIVWALAYQRYPNLFALALSHAVASIAVAIAFPLEVINGLRVGFKYFG